MQAEPARAEERDPHLAICGADDPGDLNAVVTFGPGALLFLGRGYADRAPRARPAPRFDSARGLLAETLSSLQLAKLGHRGGVDRAGRLV